MKTPIIIRINVITIDASNWEDKTNIKAYYYKNGNKTYLKDDQIEVGSSANGVSGGIATGTGAGLYTNENTLTRTWVPGAVSDKLVITNFGAQESIKPNYAAIPGGIMIQLPSSIGTTEPVTIEFELKDVFGATKTLSVIVKANK